jgi:hypothetical protein
MVFCFFVIAPVFHSIPNSVQPCLCSSVRGYFFLMQTPAGKYGFPDSISPCNNLVSAVTLKNPVLMMPFVMRKAQCRQSSVFFS